MSEVQNSLVVIRKSNDLAQLAELERILLNDEVVEVIDDPEAMSKEIMAQLLGAETDAELESFGNAIGWRELEGVPVEIRGFRWRPSDYEEGASVYFVVEGVALADVHVPATKTTPAREVGAGQLVVLTTGSRNVLAQLTNLAKRGRIPGAIRMITKSERPTRGGFHPLWLATPPGHPSQAGEPDAEPGGEPVEGDGNGDGSQ